MRRHRRVFVTVLFLLCHAPVYSEDHFLHQDGDIRLASFFPIHKAGHNGENCGEIQKEDGIQPLEAMLFTLDQINESDSLLPGITLGTVGVDSCDNPIRAAEKALPLLKGFMRRKVGFQAKNYCNNSPSQWDCGDNIVGIIGPQTSAVSLEIGNLGRLMNVPLVSYLSTSVTLCQREKFPNFFRTVPSDKHQARAIVELLKRFRWNYASFVHSDSEYGTTGYQLVKQEIKKSKVICLADPITIYNKQFDRDDYIRVVKTLLHGELLNESLEIKPFVKPKVVIVFADRVPAGKLLQAAKDLGVRDQLLWIGSDAWASRESVVENREEYVEGAIAIQPLRRVLPKYNDYFETLIAKSNPRNPWFEEYLEAYHNCSNANKTYFANCRGGSKFRQQHYIHFVRDAVYAFAHALHNLHVDSCGGFEDRLCPQFKQRVFTDLISYLANVSFKDTDENFTFRFYGHNDSYSQGSSPHDGPPRYSIINFAKVGPKNVNKIIYDWKNVGTYVDGEIVDINDEFAQKYVPKAQAEDCYRIECGFNAIKIPDTEDQCCWHCVPCGPYKYRISEYECRECPEGQKSVVNESSILCVKIDETYMEYSSPWAIGAMSVAGIGMLLTFAAFQVFWQFWGTPFVKACGRDLSLILLFGNFCSFLTTFVVVTKPTPATCGLVRFCVGFCYTVCYASVVVKTNRVWRIFHANGPVHPRFTSSFSSTMIVLGLVSIEVIINTIWLLSELPDTLHITNIPGKRILACKGVDEQIITGLIYPFFLILIATVYAFLTRKVPGGFNETKFIFFANTLTTIHWFAYVPLYLASTEHEIRPFILAFSLSVSGFVQLGCLIFPKLYTVVFKPNNNTKEKVLKPHRSRATFTVPETPPNSVAVGIADGALLGPYQYMIAPQDQVKVQFNQDDKGEAGEANCVGRRHPTWSHELHAFDRRPRSRSMSVTRSTQTKEELESQFREIKKIKFTVECADDEEDVEEEGQDLRPNNCLGVPNSTDL